MILVMFLTGREAGARRQRHDGRGAARLGAAFIVASYAIRSQSAG